MGNGNIILSIKWNTSIYSRVTFNFKEKHKLDLYKQLFVPISVYYKVEVFFYKLEQVCMKEDYEQGKPV